MAQPTTTAHIFDGEPRLGIMKPDDTKLGEVNTKGDANNKYWPPLTEDAVVQMTPE
eukprot:gene198-3362_t